MSFKTNPRVWDERASARITPGEPVGPSTVLPNGGGHHHPMLSSTTSNPMVSESELRSDPIKTSKGRLSLTLAGWKTEVVPASNRVSLKVAEHERQIRMALAAAQHKYMLAPDDTARYVWDLVMALITILLMWRVPYSIAFGEGDKLHWKIFNKSTDVIYLCDVVANFRTGYTVDADVVMDPRKVARRYLKGWFIVDLVGSIPFELFIGAHSSGIERKAIKASVKYLKVPKLFRIARLVKFVQKYMKYAYTFQCFAAYLSVIHWVACLWADHAIDLDSYSDEAYAYGEALYVAVMLMMNIGGIPVEKNDYFTVAVLCVVGFIFQALTVASVTAVIMSSSNRAVQYQEKVRMVMSDLKAMQVPVELRKSAKSYYETLWRVRNISDRYEKAIYEDEDLSPALRSEIALHVHRSLIANVPLFHDCSDSCLATVVMKLKTQLYMRGDVIFHKGEPANSMAIVNRGKIKVISPDNGTLLAVLKQGCFFGEMGLLRNMTRSCTVISATFCELKSLRRNDAEEIFEMYPQIYERLFAESEKRQRDTKQKATLYNVKVLDNAHAVDVSNIDEDETTGETSRPFMHGSEIGSGGGGSSMSSSSGSRPKLARINSLNADDGAMYSELDKLNTNIDDLQRLLDTMKGTQSKLSRVHDKRISIHQTRSSHSLLMLVNESSPSPTKPPVPSSSSSSPPQPGLLTPVESTAMDPQQKASGSFEVTRDASLASFSVAKASLKLVRKDSKQGSDR